MDRDEECTEPSLKESAEESNRETGRNLKDIILDYYTCLEELGYLPRDLYEMDMNELEDVLTNRRKGIANECFMIGMLSRTALAKEIPNTPQKMYPYMFPKPKTYKMPKILQEVWIKERGGKVE